MDLSNKEVWMKLYEWLVCMGMTMNNVRVSTYWWCHEQCMTEKWEWFIVSSSVASYGNASYLVLFITADTSHATISNLIIVLIILSFSFSYNLIDSPPIPRRLRLGTRQFPFWAIYFIDFIGKNTWAPSGF